MKQRPLVHFVAVLCGVVALSTTAFAAPIVIDFSTEDDFTTPLANGQEISTPPNFGRLFSLNSGAGRHEGLAIFDSGTNGPNKSGPDFDLLVGLGNILILQSPDHPRQGTPGFFDTPDDSEYGGEIFFDFYNPVEMLTIDLIDINTGQHETYITLYDSAGRTRNFDVPSRWTRDVHTMGPNGYDTLALNSLLPQVGEGGSTATATQTAGFDPTAVVRMKVKFMGSGALDNVVFVPEPGTLALLVLPLAALALRGRRRA